MSAPHFILVRAFHLSNPAGGGKQLGQAHPGSLHGRDGEKQGTRGKLGPGDRESPLNAPLCPRLCPPGLVECWVHLIAHVFSNSCVFQSTTGWCWVGWHCVEHGAGGAELSCLAPLWGKIQIAAPDNLSCWGFEAPLDPSPCMRTCALQSHGVHACVCHPRLTADES